MAVRSHQGESIPWFHSVFLPFPPDSGIGHVGPRPARLLPAYQREIEDVGIRCVKASSFTLHEERQERLFSEDWKPAKSPQ